MLAASRREKPIKVAIAREMRNAPVYPMTRVRIADALHMGSPGCLPNLLGSNFTSKDAATDNRKN